MMVNFGTRVAKMNVVFSTSRIAALIERKKLQYTILSIKLHQCTLKETKPMFLHYQKDFLVSQYKLRTRKNTQTRNF